MSDREAELRELVVKLASAMQPAGQILATIGTSRSKHSEEAWAAFTHIVNALNLVTAVVDRDMNGPMQ